MRRELPAGLTPRLPNALRESPPPTPSSEAVTTGRTEAPPGRASLTRARTPPRVHQTADRPVRTGRLIAAVTVTLVALNLSGASYYLLPIAERVRSPLHPLLKSSGLVGQTTGIMALAIFVFLWLYPLRKKWRWLAFTGSVGRWMDVHIVAALSLPLLLAVHATWKFGGVIGIGFWAMMIVCASGIIGRYLYVRIPRSRTGAELSLEEVAGQRRALVQQIIDATGLTLDEVQTLITPRRTRVQAPTALGALRAMLVSDLELWRTRRTIRERCRAYGPRTARLDRRAIDEVTACAAREMALAQQVTLLHATHRVFRWWHVAHRPIAITALVAVLIHVGVVAMVGATWFW